MYQSRTRFYLAYVSYFPYVFLCSLCSDDPHQRANHSLDRAEPTIPRRDDPCSHVHDGLLARAEDILEEGDSTGIPGLPQH
jgi:hypothetical protein